MENPQEHFNETQHQFAPMPQQQKVRPTVLTVFCILTFIGSGFGILALLFSIGMYAVAPDLMASQGTPAPSYVAFIGGMLFASGKLVGAGMMFKLKKPGFWAYAVCELGALAVGIMETIRTYGMGGSEDAYAQLGMPENFTSIIQVVGMVLTVAFSVVFIGVYAAQTKHMS